MPNVILMKLEETNMPEVQIIGLPHSNFVWAVRIALAEKGVAHENIPASPHSPEVTAIHPLGKIPVLRHGDLALGESRAIIDYVDGMFEGPRLVPAELGARIKSGVWTSIITSAIEPLLERQFLFAYMFPATADGLPDRVVIEAILPKVEIALDALEIALASGEIGGEPFGRTDAYLVPILFYFRNTPEGESMIAARSHLSAYLNRSLMRPSVQATMPSPQQGHA
jgi:glutathione S-transferase